MADPHRICSVPECGKPHKGKGFCSPHLERYRRHGDPIAGRSARSENGAPRAFLEKVAVPFRGCDCLVWPFAKSDFGHGIVRWRGKMVGAHVVICQKVSGHRPTPRHEVAHTCGNGNLGCVNPAHLRWAERAENIKDAMMHGTWAHGEAHGHATMTEAQARAAIALKGKMTQAHIAAHLGVGVQAVGCIHRGKTWRHLPR